MKSRKTTVFTSLVLCMLLAVLAGCGGNNDNKKKSSGSPAGVEDAAKPQADSGDDTSSGSSEEFDIDLTALSSTMVYSEVYSMMDTPEKYIGKTVKMRGVFASFKDETTGSRYFTCIIKDAAACCAQGMEFVLSDKYSYPEDYPQEDSEITVTGVFDTYEEDGYTYCTLKNAVLL